MANQYKYKILLDSVSSSQTGGTTGVSGYKKVGFQFKLANVVSGNGIFKVQGTTNGADWTFLALIDNLPNAISEGQTRVLSKTLSANSNVIMWIDDSLPLMAIRTSVTKTTDGSYSAYLIASE